MRRTCHFLRGNISAGQRARIRKNAKNDTQGVQLRKPSNPPTPFLSVAGVVHPLGSFFTRARLTAGPGQRWRAQGRRWRRRWWRSASPTSPSQRGGGSPSRRRRRTPALGDEGARDKWLRNSWNVFRKSTEVWHRDKKKKKKKEWWVMFAPRLELNRGGHSHHCCDLVLTCESTLVRHTENLSLYSFPTNTTFRTHYRIKYIYIFFKDIFTPVHLKSETVKKPTEEPTDGPHHSLTCCTWAHSNLCVCVCVAEHGLFFVCCSLCTTDVHQQASVEKSKRSESQNVNLKSRFVLDYWLYNVFDFVLK